MSTVVNFFFVGAALSAALGAILAVTGIILLVKRKKPVLQLVFLLGGLVLILLGGILLFTII